MKRLALLLPLLALAAAADPATNAPAAAFAADRARVGAKLESLRLDAFEYAGADAGAAFTLLMDKARQADADEPDPLKKGVPMVLDVAPGDAFPAIDVSLHDISLRDALDALSGPFGLECMVCGSVVKAGLRGKLLRPLEHRLAKIRAEAEVPADDAGWKELLGKAGVEWPAGSYVKFLPSVRRLVLMNTEEELAKAERALADLGLAAPRPGADEPRAEDTEGAAETISRRRAVVLDGTSRRWKREPGTTASQPPAWAAQSNVLANTFFCRLAPANRREGTENDFDIESWYFNGGSTNAAFRESLAFLLDDALVQGSTILDPDRAELVIRAISNETERVRGSHDRSGPWFAPSRPCRCRTGDRIDFLTDEFDVAVHVAQGRVPDALDLVFRRNASAAPSLLDFPGKRDPDAETTFSLFSGSTICLVAPSRIEGGVPALLLLRATMLPAP